VLAWGWLLWGGNIQTIWPMFGIANQLLAVVAMCVATTIIFNSKRKVLAPVTLVPLLFIVSTTGTAGYYMLMRFYGAGDKLNFALTAVMLSCVVIVVADSAWRWFHPRASKASGASLAAGE
jgi:carbon starvation protein